MIDPVLEQAELNFREFDMQLVFRLRFRAGEKTFYVKTLLTHNQSALQLARMFREMSDSIRENVENLNVRS